MPVAVRLVEFLSIVALFIVVSTGSFILYFADKIFLLLATVVMPFIELIQLTLMSMEYLFFWSTRYLMSLLATVGSCGTAAVVTTNEE